MELAIFLPLLLVFGLACLQFAVISMAYLSVISITRDAARTVAVHPHELDTTTTTTVKSRLPAGITANDLQFTYTPSCPSSRYSGGKCLDRGIPGTPLSVKSEYTLASHIFLPTTFGFGSLTVRIPTTSQKVEYTLTMQVEPS